MNLDLRFIPFLEGTLLAKSKEDNAQLEKIKGVGMNLLALPLQTFHALHHGVLDELRIREQCALSMINEVKMNNY